MATNIRRGQIPNAASGVGPYLDELYTLKGFFGDWAMVFRSQNTGHPIEWSNPDLMNLGADTNVLKPTDLTDATGAPMPLLKGDGIQISLSRRSDVAPFLEKNSDHHQIRFYHRGEFELQTELGPLDIKPGDFVVIPIGMMFREVPKTKDNAIVIFESRAPIRPAEELWDSVGLTFMATDYTLMEVPTPQPGTKEEIAVPTEVRVKLRDQYERLVFDFDPCKDVVGWLGDPVIYKFNVWNVPGMGSSHGFLPPPSGAVLLGDDRSFFFTVQMPRPFPNVPAPDGSYGAPAHRNDYDEFWFNHRSAHAEETEGHVWRLPPTVVHPGLKRPPEYPQNPVERIQECKLNFDTRVRLSWTKEATAAFLQNPHTAVYTSLYGAHIGILPEQALRHVKK
jgi:homogentisate 1,2-dioxygenase